MAAPVSHSQDSAVPDSLAYDIYDHPDSDPLWDGYERSVLRRVADNVQIAIRGGFVDLTVTKQF